MTLGKSALTVTAIVVVSAAWAQQTPFPEEIAWKLLEVGQVIDPPKTAQLYAPLQQKEPYPAVRIERDIKYGAAERNHGGGFVAGNKRTGNSPFYDNVMLWAVKNGFIGVNTTYRLAPQSPWPAAAEDLGAAVKWTSDYIAARGGDPKRIFLMGHSAGAVHVATYVSHPEFQKVGDGGLAGAILLSGIYDLNGEDSGDAEKAYFGTDTSLYAARSSLQGLQATKLPLMIASAELDPPRFVQQFELLKQAACKGAWMPACRYAAAAQSHVGGLFDQYAGYSSHRGDC